VVAVAEGVETLEQERHLRRLGCTTVQGFLHSRPVPAEEMGGLLAARGTPSPVPAAV
jgi:EAL domain-containing protein (putative c-di-GMP-specific phosphodiesterase class I)